MGFHPFIISKWFILVRVTMAWVTNLFIFWQPWLVWKYPGQVWEPVGLGMGILCTPFISWQVSICLASICIWAPRITAKENKGSNSHWVTKSNPADIIPQYCQKWRVLIDQKGLSLVISADSSYEPALELTIAWAQKTTSSLALSMLFLLPKPTPFKWRCNGCCHTTQAWHSCYAVGRSLLARINLLSTGLQALVMQGMCEKSLKATLENYL